MACCRRTVNSANEGCCQSPPQMSMANNECPPNTLCCNLFKAMLDPCSQALERNVRRNVYGQVRFPPPCPPLRPWKCGVKSTSSSCCPASRLSKNMANSYESGGSGCCGSSSDSCPPPPSDSCQARKPVIVSFKCPSASYPMDSGCGDGNNNGCSVCPIPQNQSLCSGNGLKSSCCG